MKYDSIMRPKIHTKASESASTKFGRRYLILSSIKDYRGSWQSTRMDACLIADSSIGRSRLHVLDVRFAWFGAHSAGFGGFQRSWDLQSEDVVQILWIVLIILNNSFHRTRIDARILISFESIQILISLWAKSHHSRESSRNTHIDAARRPIALQQSVAWDGARYNCLKLYQQVPMRWRKLVVMIVLSNINSSAGHGLPC